MTFSQAQAKAQVISFKEGFCVLVKAVNFNEYGVLSVNPEDKPELFDYETVTDFYDGKEA